MTRHSFRILKMNEEMKNIPLFKYLVVISFQQLCDFMKFEFISILSDNETLMRAISCK